MFLNHIRERIKPLQVAGGSYFAADVGITLAGGLSSNEFLLGAGGVGLLSNVLYMACGSGKKEDAEGRPVKAPLRAIGEFSASALLIPQSLLWIPAGLFPGGFKQVGEVISGTAQTVATAGPDWSYVIAGALCTVGAAYATFPTKREAIKETFLKNIGAAVKQNGVIRGAARIWRNLAPYKQMGLIFMASNAILAGMQIAKVAMGMPAGMSQQELNMAMAVIGCTGLYSFGNYMTAISHRASVSKAVDTLAKK